jgi:FKBP-type peptidyl-prolyl cis-trans isomerase
MKIGHIKTSMVFVGLALCGCEEPTDIGPVAPPGAYTPKVSPDADPAQAVGETTPISARTTTDSSKRTAQKVAPATAKDEVKTTDGGVKYQTLKEGTGVELQPGQRAVVNYEGKLADGTIFESTTSSGQAKPAEFIIGIGQMIKGWDEAIPGMKIGEVRKLTIPPEMGYGKVTKPKIPPSSTLIFEVELVGIK